MASFNKVMLIGNLTRDPEVRSLPSGVNVADLRLAVNENYTDKNGQKVEKAVYVDVAVWDKQADLCKNYLSKGSPLLVEGKLQMDEWTSKEGEKRSKLRVRAERIQFLGTRRAGAEGEPGTAGTTRRPSPKAEGEDPSPADFGEPAPAGEDTPF
jgi:single-strand DNA-binding protein